MVCVPYKFCSDPPLGGVLYAGGSYSEGGSYILVDTVLLSSVFSSGLPSCALAGPVQGDMIVRSRLVVGQDGLSCL
jgi:hypothetical protein